MTTRKKASGSGQSRQLAPGTSGITVSNGLPGSSKPNLQVATSALIVLQEYVRHYFAQEESLLAEEEQAFFSEIRESGQKATEIGQVLQHATQNLQAIGTDWEHSAHRDGQRQDRPGELYAPSFDRHQL